MAMFYIVAKRPIFLTPTTTLRFCSASSQPSSDHDTAVATAVSVLKHHRSKSRWTHLRTLFPSGFNPSQFSQITIQLRNNPHLSLRFFLFTIQHSLCNHSLLSYATIIHTLARSRQKSHALTLIKSAIRKFPDGNTTSLSSSTPRLIFETLISTYRMCDSAPFVFDLLIKACLKSKRINQGLEIVRMLRTKGISPMISTCNSLIMSVCKHHGGIAGYEVYSELFGSTPKFEDQKIGVKIVVPNVHTYNIMMLGFYRDGLIEKVEEVWSDMIVNNCLPSVYSYSILMAGYCDNGRIEEAMRVWEEMKNKGLKHDVMAYNTIIGGLCEGGEVHKAEEFFKEMGLSGEESSCVTYEHLIKGYCKIGDVESAMILYKDMCRKEFTPMGTTIDMLIKELCEKNKVLDALKVSRFAMKRNNVAMKGESYELLIKGLCNEGRMDEGMKVQAEMVGRGYEPNLKIYVAFIEGYEKEGNNELAAKLKMELFQMQ